jgi:hypothetical protein
VDSDSLNPDPIRTQGFGDQKLKDKIFLKLFLSKIAIYLSLASIKDAQATGEAFSLQK